MLTKFTTLSGDVWINAAQVRRAESTADGQTIITFDRTGPDHVTVREPLSHVAGTLNQALLAPELGGAPAPRLRRT